MRHPTPLPCVPVARPGSLAPRPPPFARLRGVTTPEPAEPAHAQPSTRRPRIAYLSFSSGEFDARTARMARSSLAAGFEVVVYARRQAGLPAVEVRDGYLVLRAPWRWWMAIPGAATLRRRLPFGSPTSTSSASARSRSAAPTAAAVEQ